MAVTEVFTGMPVSDYASAEVWYERLAGRPADFKPNAIEAVWNLGVPASWLYIVLDPVRAGNALLTVLVGNLDAQLAELEGRKSRSARSRRSRGR